MKTQEIAFLSIFFISVFVITLIPYVAIPNYYTGYSDAAFHIELVKRIQQKEPLNTAMNLDVLPLSWQRNFTRNNWSADYVTSYPKLLHYMAASTGLQPNMAIGVIVSFLLILLLGGIFALCQVIGQKFFNSVLAMALFVVISELVTWRYFYYYQMMIYAQLLLNVLIVWGFAGLIDAIKRKKPIMALAVIICSGIFILNTHNFFYNSFEHTATVYSDSLSRLLPLEISLGLPLLLSYPQYKFMKPIALSYAVLTILFVVGITFTSNYISIMF
jgi:hypothetical protein